MELVIERLNKETAYIKNKPIYTSDKMPTKIVTDKIDEEWMGNLKEANPFWLREFNGDLSKQTSGLPSEKKERFKHLKEILILRDRLLTFGGEQACMPAYEEDLKKIMERGQLWYGDRLKMMKGAPSQCHWNSCQLWDANKEKTKIATGYALTKDGLWRQHSWVIWIKPRKNIVVETTEKRVAYFGYVMTNEECEEFWENNF